MRYVAHTVQVEPGIEHVTPERKKLTYVGVKATET
jgi:hypothetical protein